MTLDANTDLLFEYIDTVEAFLGIFEGRLMELSARPAEQARDDALVSILSELHTFKGNSGMMGLDFLKRYAHNLEDIVQAMQRLPADPPEAIQFLLEAATTIRSCLEQLTTTPAQAAQLIEQAIGTLVSWRKHIASTWGAEQDGAEHDAPAPVEERMVAKTTSNVMRVDFRKLDELLSKVGELVTSRTRMSSIEEQIRQSSLDRSLLTDLSETTEQLARATTDLHDAILKMRMMPLRNLFSRFPSLVHTLATKREKEVQLTMQGEETELDKALIDELKEPLLHLIQNAVDHGIEQPAKRQASGKAPCGSITLNAYQESNHIIVTLKDDGDGIDVDHLRDRAISRNLVTPEAARELPLATLMMLRGLSTAESVDEVSGRGIGMDIVETRLRKMGGTLHVETTRGKGSQFTIKLPLTLAIISALMVRVGKDVFAIPMHNVRESARIDNNELHLVNNRECLSLRDSLLPIKRLSELFGSETTAQTHHTYIVVAQSAQGNLGLVVDEILGHQEIVIKALDTGVGQIPGISGATIMSQGHVILIIDVADITRSAKMDVFHPTAPLPPTPMHEQRNVL